MARLEPHERWPTDSYVLVSNRSGHHAGAQGRVVGHPGSNPGRATNDLMSDVRPRIILFNLYHDGHHPQHLECLLRDWARRRRRGELHLVVSERHARVSSHIPALVRDTPATTLHLVQTPAGFGDGPENVVRRERLHRRFAAHYARRLEADHLLFMYFDHAQLSLALNLRFPWPLALSGIYFRPSFHYGALEGPTWERGQRLLAWGKQVVLRAALRNPHLRTLFCLDPLAAPEIARWAVHTESVFLPEPLWIPDSPGEPSLLERELEPRRRRLVFFGSLDDRKGIRPVLDALATLPGSSQSRLALVFAGPVRGAERDELLARIERLDQTSDVQVLLHDRFVPEADVQQLLGACDLLLLTYRHHVGSSGVLIRAAAAGIPVLSTDFGLVGAQVRSHRLGLTLDANSSAEIRSALLAWLDRPDAIPFDPASARSFAAANTAEAFAETIFARLLGPNVQPL
jgi:glycosyltransferase involved in cell wall biosynthesis